MLFSHAISLFPRSLTRHSVIFPFRHFVIYRLPLNFPKREFNAPSSPSRAIAALLQTVELPFVVQTMEISHVDFRIQLLNRRELAVSDSHSDEIQVSHESALDVVDQKRG